MNSYHTTINSTACWITDGVYVRDLKCHIGRDSYHKITNVEFMCDITNIADVSWIDSDGNKKTLDNKPADANTLMIAFSESYLKACDVRHMASGVYYSPCECCVDDFEMEESMLPQSDDEDEYERHDVKKRYTEYLVTLPTMRLTVTY